MKLEIGSRNEDVKQLQNMLNYLGYNCGIADGWYGVLTERAVNAYKTDKYVNGIYDDNTAYLLVNEYTKKKSEEAAQNKGYRKIRMFDSDIHIYETSPYEYVDVTLGIENKLEKLSKIDNPNIEEVCKINCGFFNFDGSREHLGMYLHNGKLYQNPDNTFINFLYFKNGKTDIKYYDNNFEEIRYWLKELNWGIGCGWSLVKNGKIDLTGASIFDHSNSKNPRTMFGVKADKSFVLVVADGRSATSKGLTAKEQAEVMLSLDCTLAVSGDGGGSAEMIVEDKIVNKPSDNTERSIGSAIIVYRK